MKNEFYQIYKTLFGSEEIEKISDFQSLYSKLFSDSKSIDKKIDLEALEFFSRITKCGQEIELTKKFIFTSFIGEFSPKNYKVFHNEKNTPILKSMGILILTFFYSLLKFFKGAFICLYLRLWKKL